MLISMFRVMASILISLLRSSGMRRRYFVSLVLDNLGTLPLPMEIPILATGISLCLPRGARAALAGTRGVICEDALTARVSVSFSRAEALR